MNAQQIFVGVGGGDLIEFEILSSFFPATPGGLPAARLFDEDAAAARCMPLLVCELPHRPKQFLRTR